jgi:shikimate dehydrogenase
LGKLAALQNLLANDLRVFSAPFFEGMERLSSATPAGGVPARPGESGFLWRTPSLDFFEQWRVSGIVGGRYPSRYSESPDLWNHYFRKLNVKAAFFAFDLPAAGKLLTFLNCWLSVAGALDLTITDPYKHEVYRALQELRAAVRPAPQVQETLAVNHLIRDEKTGRVLALNTDGLGMARALAGRLDLEGRRVLLLGAGGSAVSIGAELLRRRCRLWIANRTPSRAREVAESFMRLCSGGADRCPQIAWSGFEGIEDVLPECDLLINTVSAGCPIGASQIARLPAGAVVAETKYGAQADLEELARGRAYVDGRAMLFGQFVEAAETVRALLGVSRKAHLRALSGFQGRRRFSPPPSSAGLASRA